MNGYQPYNFYQLQSVVDGFRTMPREALAQLREELCLSMGIGELIFCQNQYKKENRDPEKNELLLLDSLISDCEKKPSAFLFTEANPKTEQEARTLADLLSKLEAINQKKPYSFADLASAASLYLIEAGKRTATPGIYGKCAELGTLEFSAKGASALCTVGFESFNSCCTLGIPAAPAYSKESANDTDSFIAVFKSPSSDIEFENAILELVSTPEINRSIKRADTAESGGALRFMLDSAKGFFADIAAFASLNEELSPSLLTKKHLKAVFLLADAKAFAAIQNRAAQLGLVAFCFARPLSAPLASIRCSAQMPLNMNADFLRSIRFTAPVKIEASDIKTNAVFSVAHGLADNIIYSAVAVNDPGFESAAEAIVCAIAPLVARGIEFENISISTDAKLPLLTFDPSSAGSALSMLLGTYRAEAELALRSEGDRCICTSDSLSLCAYARALDPNIEISDKITKASGSLYVFSPRKDENGLFDFDSLRKLFKFISTLAKSKRASAIRAVGHEDFFAALAEMTQGAVLSDYMLPEVIREFPAGSFIVESTQKLPGLCVNFKKAEDDI